MVLNAKPTTEVLMNYKRAPANILEDKAWYQTFRQLLD